LGPTGGGEYRHAEGKKEDQQTGDDVEGKGNPEGDKESHRPIGPAPLLPRSGDTEEEPQRNSQKQCESAQKEGRRDSCRKDRGDIMVRLTEGWPGIQGDPCPTLVEVLLPQRLIQLISRFDRRLDRFWRIPFGIEGSSRRRTNHKKRDGEDCPNRDRGCEGSA